ncbi:hypothetical protein EDC01DRAFT_746904 [Geopyxis carbonaria]|nr:hypothetical protein EDC01DRAFT_746904 [Geopyxis carbonaria]
MGKTPSKILSAFLTGTDDSDAESSNLSDYTCPESPQSFDPAANQSHSRQLDIGGKRSLGILQSCLTVLDDPYTIPRKQTVETLAKHLDQDNFMHLRGPPASGKTTLAKLLYNHLSMTEQHVAFIPVWSHEEPYQSLLIRAAEKEGLRGLCWHEICNTKITFIIDQGHISYSNTEFWLDFVKTQAGRRWGPRLVVFSSYAPPTTGACAYPSGVCGKCYQGREVFRENCLIVYVQDRELVAMFAQNYFQHLHNSLPGQC